MRAIIKRTFPLKSCKHNLLGMHSKSGPHSMAWGGVPNTFY